MRRPAGALEREVARWQAAAAWWPPRDPVAPGQESVWDYPRPPRLEPCTLTLRVEVAGMVLAHTERGLRLLETASPPTYYFPPQDVRCEFLISAAGSSWCEWKGRAVYWDFTASSIPVRHIAWSYPDPFDEYAELAGYIAFFVQRSDACWVGEEQATPQPGGFYGGWITRSIAGPFKGSPGSEGW